jgi:hypothetical protein
MSFFIAVLLIGGDVDTTAPKDLCCQRLKEDVTTSTFEMIRGGMNTTRSYRKVAAKDGRWLRSCSKMHQGWIAHPFMTVWPT